MNLLEETKSDIEASGHTIQDVVYIGSLDSGHSMDWETFALLADREYDDGYGAQKVASDLVVLFSDGAYMWRHEYDGSEWWMYQNKVEIPAKTKPLTRLFVSDKEIGWLTAAELMKGQP